jgi:flagellar motor switch protein FliN
MLGLPGSAFEMQTVENVELDIAVVIGRSVMPIHHLLRMGRGAVIELNANENDEVEILANNFPVARGQVVVQGKRIQVEVTSLLKKPETISRRFSHEARKTEEAF